MSPIECTIMKLPDIYRDVIILKYGYNLPYNTGIDFFDWIVQQVN